MSQGGLASPRRLPGFRLTGRTTTSEPPRLNSRYARLKSPPFSTRAALSMENRRSRLCRTGARSGLSRFEGGLVLFDGGFWIFSSGDAGCVEMITWLVSRSAFRLIRMSEANRPLIAKDDPPLAWIALACIQHAD